MTQRYFDDSEFNVNMVNAIRVDYWQMYGWANIVSNKWHTLIQGLPRVCSGNDAEVRSLMSQVGELPPMPEPKHLELERKRIAVMKNRKEEKSKNEEE